MGNQPGMKERLGYTAAALGQSLAGGDGVGMVMREQENRRRLEDVAAQRALENERYMRNFMDNKLARLQQDKRYEEGIARQGQYRAEDLARADIEGMNRRNDAALGMEREDRQAAERLAMDARRADLAEVEAMNRNNNAMLGFDAEQRQFDVTSGLAKRKLEEVEIPAAKSKLAGGNSIKEQMDNDPAGHAAAMASAQDKATKLGIAATPQMVMAEYARMNFGGGQDSSPKPLRPLGDPNAEFFPAIRGK